MPCTGALAGELKSQEEEIHFEGSELQTGPKSSPAAHSISFVRQPTPAPCTGQERLWGCVCLNPPLLQAPLWPLNHPEPSSLRGERSNELIFPRVMGADRVTTFIS